MVVLFCMKRPCHPRFPLRERLFRPFGRRSRRAPGGVLRTSSAMTEIIVARPVIPAIFAFHSAILGALRYRAAPKLFEA